jgi:ribosomal protein S18 acetylase RimI-like enzyme
MTRAEFDAFRARVIIEYAADNVRAGNWTAEESQARSTEQTDALLSQGLGTPGVLLLSGETEDRVLVGQVWVALDRPSGFRCGAWLYNIWVAPEERGKGYGRALLHLAEQETRRQGVGSLGLNVFGSNTTARRLYESAGYEVVSLQMRKTLA